MLCCDLRHLAGYATIDTAIPCRISLSLSHASLLISPTFENLTANRKARSRIRKPSRINKFTWKRVFLSISYKYDMLTWILTQPYQQDPENVACVDLDFSLVDSSVNSQVIDGTRKHKVNGILTGVVLTVDAEIQRSGGGIHAQWWSIISVPCLAWRLRFQEVVNLED